MHVGKELLLVFTADVEDGRAPLYGAGDDLIVDVRDVALVANAQPEVVLEDAADDVEGDVCARVAQVGRVVDRGAADVGQDCAGCVGPELLEAPGEAVGEPDGGRERGHLSAPGGGKKGLTGFEPMTTRTAAERSTPELQTPAASRKG